MTHVHAPLGSHRGPRRFTPPAFTGDVLECPHLYLGACFLLTIASLSAPPAAYASQDSATRVSFTLPFRIPAQVGSLRLADSTMVGEAVVLSYDGPNVAQLHVFVYAPLRDTSQASVRSALMDEVESFKQSLPVGLSRGWYDVYRFAFESEKSIRAGDVVVPGHAVAIAFARGESTFVSLVYVHAFRGMLIKTRLTIPEAGWDTNAALTFPGQFIEQLASVR